MAIEDGLIIEDGLVYAYSQSGSAGEQPDRTKGKGVIAAGGCVPSSSSLVPFVLKTHLFARGHLSARGKVSSSAHAVRRYGCPDWSIENMTLNKCLATPTMAFFFDPVFFVNRLYKRFQRADLPARRQAA